MRITFVCPVADLTGGFRVIVTYARELQRRGHEVLVVSRPPRRATPREVLRSIYRRRPLPSLPRSAPTHVDSAGVPHKQLDRVRPVVAGDLPDADLVLATWWETAEWVAALPREKGVQVHFVQDYELQRGFEARVKAVLRLSMAKITPSRWVERLLREQCGNTRVTCIPNAVDHATFHAPPRGKQSSPVVGFTYDAFPPKGCDISIEAIRLARSARPELAVVSFGSRPPVPELRLPAGADFHLRAIDPQLRGLYARCDAWLFGTRQEGFGLPILEAMACRTPVIGTPAGAAPDLLGEGGGILIPGEDPRAMAEAILNVSAMSDADWRRMSDTAYATASRCTWEDAADAFEAALERAVDEARESAVAMA